MILNSFCTCSVFRQSIISRPFSLGRAEGSPTIRSSGSAHLLGQFQCPKHSSSAQATHRSATCLTYTLPAVITFHGAKTWPCSFCLCLLWRENLVSMFALSL